MRKIVVLIIASLLIAGSLFWFFRVREKPASNGGEGEKETMVLPENWSFSPLDDPSISLKLERRIEDLVRPTVVMIKSETSETDFSAYLDRLIAGAKRTLPSLKVTSETEEEKEGFHLKKIEAYYYNGGNKVNLRQRVYLKEDRVYTLTASFGQTDPETVSRETETIFDSIFQEKILL